MPADPSSDSPLLRGQIPIAISNTMPVDDKYVLTKWLFNTSEAVPAGEPIAEIMRFVRNDGRTFAFYLAAPTMGILTYDPVIVLGSVVQPGEALGYIRKTNTIVEPFIGKTPTGAVGVRWFIIKWFKADTERAAKGDRIVKISKSVPAEVLRKSIVLRTPVAGTLLHSRHELASEEWWPPPGYPPHSQLFTILPEAISKATVDRMMGVRLPPQIPRPVPPVRKPPAEIRASMADPDAGKYGVFISYRRSDQAAFAGRLYDHLVHAFNKSTVFMDVDSIGLGLDFTNVLHEALERCRVVIAVIGRDWLTAADEAGALRLDDPDDFVRLEIETALERGLRLIPVLVDGAPMPRSTSLPESMASLTRRNGREVSNARFGSDTIELINTLRRILGRDSEDS